MASGKYRKLVQELAAQIRSGTIRPGQRLPTHRDLAHRHKLSLGTATRVYAELLELGLVTGEVGRGTFARSPIATAASSFHYDREAPSVIDLSRNFMVLPSQARQLRAATESELADQADELLLYQPHVGRDRDRIVAANWLSDKLKNFEVEPSRIAICNGGQHGLTLSLLAATQPGDTVAVETFTYPGIKTLAQVLRLHLLPIATDSHGLIPEALEDACRSNSIKAVYCMPTLQNPLGITMPDYRRRSLAHVADRHNLRMVEDDAYGFLTEEAPSPIAALIPERTYYLRTVSKSLAPGLRVALIAAPLREIATLTRILRATTWTAPPLMAGIVTRWIVDGTADRIIAEKRIEMRKRYEMAKHILSSSVTIDDQKPGMHLWLKLPEGCRTDDVLVAARDHNVLVSPASLFYAGETLSTTPQAIRLCLGAPRDRNDLDRALHVVADTIKVSTARFVSTV
jgi:DNA-binding transcriptional MocR family regulator